MAAARLLARRTTAARGPWAPAWRAFSIADESSYHSGSDAGFSAVPRLFSAEYTSPLQYAGTPHAEPHVITLAAAEGIGDDGHRLEALAANLSDEADSTPVTPFADGPAAGSVTTGVDASVANFPALVFLRSRLGVLCIFIPSIQKSEAKMGMWLHGNDFPTR